MIRAARPARVHEGVVDALLDVIDNAMLEIARVAELADARRSLFDDHFMARSDRVHQIAREKADDTRFLCRRDAACLFANAPRLLAGGTVRNAFPDHQVTTAEQLVTQDAEPPPLARKGCGAFGARERHTSRNVVHRYLCTFKGIMPRAHPGPLTSLQTGTPSVSKRAIASRCFR
jgi:hypothetical protein